MHCIEATLATKSGDSLLMSQSSWKESYPPPDPVLHQKRQCRQKGNRRSGRHRRVEKPKLPVEIHLCDGPSLMGQKEEKLG